MDKAPEQSIVDYLESVGYESEAIIQYLEQMVEKEWAQSDFAECGPGEKMTFGVCRKVDGAPEQPQAQVPSQGSSQEKPKEKPKSAMEEKLEKAAKAQGSDVNNNKKVMIDGKAYGWAVLNGKPIMVEWGKVAGEKKVGPKQAKPKRSGGGSSNAGRIKGLEKALAKQTTEAGRKAIQKQIDELKAQG